MSGIGQKDEIHRHSGWLIPAVFFFALLVLSGLVLGWYLRPGPKSAALPTGQSTMVLVTVRGIPLSIPANYIESAAARAGGEMDAITLVALFPSWHGYSDAEARLFSGNAPDLAVIHLSLRASPNLLDGRARLDRVYRPYIANPSGAAGPFGLIQYGFAKESGYEDNDLFTGGTEKNLLLFLCERTSPQFPSPNCLAIDRPLAGILAYSYRFKRAYLARWQELSSGVPSLIARFEAKRGT